MNKKEIITELKEEKKVLEERLGNVKLALRGFGLETTPPTTDVKVRTRVNITPQMKEKYQREVVAVLEAFGSSTVKQLVERGNFESLSQTSIYRLAMTHPRVDVTRIGKTLTFSLK